MLHVNSIRTIWYLQEAYKKYVEGLALVSTILKDEVNSLHQPNIVNMHKHMLEFAKRSTDRLLMIHHKLGIKCFVIHGCTLECKFTHSDRYLYEYIFFQDPKYGTNGHSDIDSFEVIERPSAYQILSDTLPEIRTNTPAVPINFSGEEEWCSKFHSIKYTVLMNTFLSLQVKRLMFYLRYPH